MASTKIPGVKPLSGMKGTHLTKGTTAKSSAAKLKIPKPRKPKVTAVDKFSSAGMAKVKKARGTKKSKMRNPSPYASPGALGPLYKELGKKRTRKPATTMKVSAPKRRRKTVG